MTEENVRRDNEDYIIQVAEETEGRMTTKMSQEFIVTQVDEFCLDSQVLV